MNALELLSHLRKRQVRLWVEGGRLRYSACKGSLTSALRTELAAHKAEIVALLRKGEGEEGLVRAPIRLVSRDEALPLSFAQQRLWFMDQLLPSNPLFNLNTAHRVRAQLDAAVLERSLNAIVARHEALRTTFAAVDGQPVQLVARSHRLALPVVDLSVLPEREREARALRLATEEAQRPFDLARGPLVRATVLRLNREEYIFLLTMHHIVSDGWSMGIFWKELSTLFSAFAAGKPSPLPELPVQYADFAVWQREWLQGEVLETQWRYWKTQLADLPVLQLPTDRPRPAVQTFRGVTHSLKLPMSLTTAVKALSQREGVTLFMTLLAAFQALLYRYTGQDDVVMGSYIAGRNRAEIEGLIGFFLNTLVLRGDLAGNPTFRELLSRVRKMTLEAYAHQDVPFAKLVEELQPERDLSRNPLFQVVFQLLNVPTLSQGAATSTMLEVHRGTTIFDLTCTLWESAEGLSGHLEYSTDLFEAGTMARMAEHYQTLLEGVVAHPEQRLSELPLLSEAERCQILKEWNATSKEYSYERGIVDLFEAQVAQNPQATAFIYEGEGLQYGELNRRANQLAHYLRSLGVGPEVFVGVCLERSLEFVVALWGVLKAGGAYLPLDPSYPPGRLAFMLEDGRASVLLTEKKFAAMFPAPKACVVCLDAEEETIAGQSESDPLQGTTAEHLAYVIYTSGSTGQPKGVAVEHKQLLNRLAWMWETYPFEAHEVGGQKTALNFVDSLWELLGPLLRGIPTVIIPERIVQDPYALVEILAHYRITRLWVVPSLLRMMLDAYPDLQGRLPALRFWVTSGEAISVELWERFRQLLPGSVLYNLYGTSEVWDVTWYDPRRQQGPLWRVPLGRPISNVQCYVLDSRLQPVPIGVAGELHVGGVGLARGYLGRPELTAEKFIPHPFSSGPGARLYKSGDLVRYLPEGNIEFLGRMDQQVKIRGFRIELGEVEALLSQHPAVREAVVVSQDDSMGEKRLVAYAVIRPEAALTPPELRTFLRKKLPEHMLPAAFVILDKLPLTPNGKVDRRALPAPDKATRQPEETYTAPQTNLEEVITTVWQEVLALDRIGIDDNFFDLGGHSLLMIQIHTRLNQLLSKELSVVDLFRFPTVSSLAGYLSQEQDDRTSFRHVQERAKKQREAMSKESRAMAARSI